MAKRTATQPLGFDTVGLVGLGLMGRGIATCLLANGLKVVAYNRTASRRRVAVGQIAGHVGEVIRRKMRTRAQMKGWKMRLTVTGAVDELGDCPFIIESVKEDLALKRDLYDRLEAVVPARTIIASNTSSIPVTVLQAGRVHPERFIVMHWAEPAWITPYLEIVPGPKTSPRTKRLTRQLGLTVGKNPTLANFDIRGFISNRMMYAMMREACHLVEAGVADVETVDRSFRNDIGCWASIAGPFRWMDLTGVGAYATVMEGLFPELSDRKTLPRMMKRLRDRGAEGISNGRGHYRYSPAEARRWEKAWVDFTYDLQALLAKYDRQVGGL